jgi:hypothetical protein
VVSGLEGSAIFAAPLSGRSRCSACPPTEGGLSAHRCAVARGQGTRGAWSPAASNARRSRSRRKLRWRVFLNEPGRSRARQRPAASATTRVRCSPIAGARPGPGPSGRSRGWAPSECSQPIPHARESTSSSPRANRLIRYQSLHCP